MKNPGLDRLPKSTEFLAIKSSYLSVWQFVTLLQGRRTCCRCHLLLEVESEVAELLLDVPDDFPFGGRRETVTPLGQDFHQVICQITSSQIQS